MRTFETRPWRHLRAALMCTAMAAGLGLGATYAQTEATQQAQSVIVPELPMVEGPIEGPGEMHPSVRGPATHPFLDEMPPETMPEHFGYVTQEYFVSGEAGGAPYKTRIVIRRPADVAEFSGMVMVEVMHPSSSALIWQAARVGMMKNGHVAVEIDDQPGRIETLKGFNAERYADLSVGEGAANKDVIAQVARLIKEQFPAGEEWSQAIKAVVLAGTSATSATALDYMSTHHASHRLEDGSPLFDGFLPAATGNEIPVYDIPTIHNPTQIEVFRGSAEGSTPAYRREDSDEEGNQFRLYEYAGMPHLETREAPAFDAATCDESTVSQFMYNAATFQVLEHLFNWVAYDIVPPRAEHIEVDNDESGDGSQLALDEFGNAQGGIRSPQLDVPTATFIVPNSGENRLCELSGYDIAFSSEQLSELYEGQEDYATQLQTRAYELMREGWFPVEYWYEIEDEIARFGD